MSQEQELSASTTEATSVATPTGGVAISSSTSSSSSTVPTATPAAVSNSVKAAAISPSTRARLLRLKWKDLTPDELEQRVVLLREQEREEAEHDRRIYGLGESPPLVQKEHWTRSCVILIVMILSLFFVPTSDAIPMRFHRHDREPTVMVPSAPTTILTPPVHVVKEPMTTLKSPLSSVTTSPPPQKTFDIIACCLPGHESWQKNGAGMSVATCTPTLCLDATKSGELDLFAWASKLPIDPESQLHRMQHETVTFSSKTSRHVAKMRARTKQQQQHQQQQSPPLHSFTESESRTSSSHSSFFQNQNVAWPNGIIPYKWSPEILAAAPKHRTAIQYAYTIAIYEWQNGTCVTFTESPDAPIVMEFRYVLKGNSESSVGREGSHAVKLRINMPLFSLSLATPTVRPDAVHELGHALGLHHTHNRPDRNQHVHVDLAGKACTDYLCPKKHEVMVQHLKETSSCFGFANYASASKSQFLHFAEFDPDDSPETAPGRIAVWQFIQANPTTWTPKDVQPTCATGFCMALQVHNYDQLQEGILLTPYEYESVMHYPFNDCLRPLDSTITHSGKNEHPTRHDFDAVCQLYGCGVKVEASGLAHRTEDPPGQLTSWTYSRYFPNNTQIIEVQRVIERELVANRNGHYSQFDPVSLFNSIATNVQIRQWNRLTNAPTQLFITPFTSIGTDKSFDIIFGDPPVPVILAPVPPPPPSPILHSLPPLPPSPISPASSSHLVAAPLPPLSLGTPAALPVNPSSSTLPQPQPLLVGNAPEGHQSTRTTQFSSIGSPVNRRSSVQLDDSID